LPISEQSNSIRLNGRGDIGATNPGVLISSGGAAVKAFAIRAFTSQTATLTEWQNSAGAILGSVSAIGDLSLAGSSGVTLTGGGGFRSVSYIDINTIGITTSSTGVIGFSSGANGATYDTALFRDATGTLAQRNAGVAQTFRLYNTYTDATTFERLNLKWDTNVLKLGTEKGSVGGAARDLVLETDATERLRVLSTGNVGIGTNAPSYLLDVKKSGGTGVIIGNFADTSNNSRISFRPYNTSIEAFVPGVFGTTLQLGGGGFSVIDSGSTGNTLFSFDGVGLHVKNIISSSIAGATYNQLKLTSNWFPSGDTTNPAINFTVYNSLGSSDQLSKLQIFNGDNGKVIINPSAGNVGIGTTDPSSILTVSGLNISDAATPGSDYLRGILKVQSSDSWAVDKGGSIAFSGPITTGTQQQVFGGIAGRKENSGDGNARGYVAIYASGSGSYEKMRIDSNGNVGIGNIAPAAKLNVVDIYMSGSGSLAGSVLNLAQTWNTTGTPTAIKLNVTNTASSAASNLLDLQVGTVSQFKVDKSGVVSFANSATGGGGGGQGGIFNEGGLYVLWSAGAVGAGAGGFLGFNNNNNYTTSGGWDVRLFRDAAGILAQRNLANAQTFRLYNTYTDATTFERLNLKWDTNVLKIGTEKGSVGGAARAMEFQTDGATRMTVTSAGNVGIGTTSPLYTLDVNGAIGTSYNGIILGASVYSIDVSVANSISYKSSLNHIFSGASTELMRLVYPGNLGLGNNAPTAKLDIVDIALAGSGALSGSILNLAQTWNTTGTPTAIKLNVTNTASNAASNLLDLQVGTVSQFKVDKVGVVTGSQFNINGANNGLFGSGTFTDQLFIRSGNVDRMAFDNTQAFFIDNFGISTSRVNNPDVKFFRDAAGIFAQRNAGAAQTFRLYNTYTDATTFERLNLKWDTNVLKIGTEKGSVGGAARAMEFQTDGATRIAIAATGSVTIDSVVIGRGAGTNSTNIAIGGGLASNTSGGSNTVVGASALFSNTTGGSNTAFGIGSIYSNTIGGNNSAIGTYSLYGNTGGNGNSAIGVNSGRFLADGAAANIAGESSLFLGAETKALAGSQTNQIVIGYGATGLGSNSVVLGNSSIATTALRGNVGIGTIAPSANLQVGPSDSGNFIVTSGSGGSDGSVALRWSSSERVGFTSNAVQYGISGITGGAIRLGGATTFGFIVGDWSNGNILLNPTTSGKIGIGTIAPTEKLDVVGNAKVSGHFSAATKSFLIPHPTKAAKQLQYACLEGPENGVYIRGKTNESIILLPEYWRELVDEDSVTVTLTQIGKPQQLFVASQNSESVEVGNVDGFYNYVIFGERKDVDKLQTEI
jgi:cytoskeletal protein CcmA (bactofilin family)